MTWTCYWTEETGEALLGLRRYAHDRDSGLTCETGYHASFVWLDERIPAGNEDLLPEPDHADPRWPTTCDQCTYEFVEDDHWQPWSETIMRRTDTGALCVDPHTDTPPDGIGLLGAGAMRDAHWAREIRSLNPAKPDDGIVLQVVCPSMDGRAHGQPWIVDLESSRSGGYWTRTGDPRDPASLTVSPSIAIGLPSSPDYYHGFLQSGVLTDHIG